MDMSRKSNSMSVDDIIKSIKGIIENNQSNMKNNNAEDILELTDIVDEKNEIDYHNNIFLNGEDKAKNKNIDESSDSLISPNLAKDTANLIKEFANTARSINAESRKKKNVTIEDMVVEIIKPHLKNWLDENLPKLVQELVEKEIKRLVSEYE